MSINLHTSKQYTGKQSAGQAPQAVPSRKREKSETPLFLALMIGVCAAAGIIFAANSEPDQTLSNMEPPAQFDRQR